MRIRIYLNIFMMALVVSVARAEFPEPKWPEVQGYVERTFPIGGTSGTGYYLDGMVTWFLTLYRPPNSPTPLVKCTQGYSVVVSGKPGDGIIPDDSWMWGVYCTAKSNITSGNFNVSAPAKIMKHMQMCTDYEIDPLKYQYFNAYISGKTNLFQQTASEHTYNIDLRVLGAPQYFGEPQIIQWDDRGGDNSLSIEDKGFLASLFTLSDEFRDEFAEWIDEFKQLGPFGEVQRMKMNTDNVSTPPNINLFWGKPMRFFLPQLVNGPEAKTYWETANMDYITWNTPVTPVADWELTPAGQENASDVMGYWKGARRMIGWAVYVGFFISMLLWLRGKLAL